MRKIKSRVTWVASLAVLGALVGPMLGTLAGRSLPSQAVFTEIDVPYEMRVRQGAGAIRKGYQEGRIRTSSVEKQVFIGWTSSAIANQPPVWTAQWSPQGNALDGNKAQSGIQEFSTRYFPTASCVLAEDAIVVAGITTAGETVVERWSLAWPTPMPSPLANQAGVTAVSVALPSRAGVRRVYSADVVGRRYVRNLCALRRASGPPTDCLVQFYDSNDLYSLNLNTGQATLVASAVNASGALGMVPGLQPKNHSAISFGNRTGVGYAYTLRRGMKSSLATGSPTAPPVVVLVDGNRDGVVDSALQMTAADYAQQGWSNLNNYESWWLE